MVGLAPLLSAAAAAPCPGDLACGNDENPSLKKHSRRVEKTHHPRSGQLHLSSLAAQNSGLFSILH